MENLVHKLRELFGEDDSIKANVVKSFSQQIKNSTSSIENFYKEENWSELHKEAHKLKSSSRLLGFREIADLLQSIESLSKSNPTIEKVSKNYTKLTRKLLLVDSTCNKYLQSL